MSPEALPAAAKTSDETAREVVEVALFWWDDLLSVSYVPKSAQPSLADWDLPAQGPLELPRGAVGEVVDTCAGAFTIRATVVHEGRRVGRRRAELRPLFFALGAAVLHAVVFVALAWHAPAARSDDIDLMRSYLAASDARSAHGDVGAGFAGHGDETTGEPGGTGTSAKGDPGKMGQPTHEGHGRFDRVPARDSEGASLDEARSFGVIGLLAPASDHATTFAADPGSLGTLWGTVVGDASGAAGLSLSGTGAGGGGLGTGVGLGTIGTVGRGSGTGTGEDTGPGGLFGTCDDTCMGTLGGVSHGSGRVQMRQHLGAIIRCRLVGIPATVQGRLPPETIQRIVRASFGRFRGCYEAGLARSPTLRGRVSTKFVIGRDGSVSAVADAGSDLPDATVTSCVQSSFRALEFPEPAGGIVTVTYPLEFSPE